MADSGLEIISLEKISGIFWLLGKIFGNAAALIWHKTNWLKPLLFSLYFFRVFLSIFFYILFHLDTIDERKDWTLGYTCICEKPK